MSAQWAPFNYNYEFDNSSSETFEVFPSEYEPEQNVYLGSVYQMVTSALAKTDPLTYNSTTNYQRYGFEYTRMFSSRLLDWYDELTLALQLLTSMDKEPVELRGRRTTQRFGLSRTRRWLLIAALKSQIDPSAESLSTSCELASRFFP